MHLNAIIDRGEETMDIFLDLERTLLRSDFTLSNRTIETLSELAKEHKIYVLTYAGLQQVRSLLPDTAITIVSVLENRTDPILDLMPLPASITEYFIQNPFVFSMHSLIDSTCRIYKYQERLKKLYSTNVLTLSNAEEAYAILFACIKEGLPELQEHLPNVHIEILAEDKRNLFCKASLFPSTKADFVKKFKKSPAIGIGDSLSDFSFIQLCEIQVAMKNSEEDLKPLCQYQTPATNDEDGVIDFLLNYLKHQQS